MPLSSIRFEISAAALRDAEIRRENPASSQTTFTLQDQK
jgi:hypothetical protein